MSKPLYYLSAYPQHPNGDYPTGLSKRELFAAMAMQGLMGTYDVVPPVGALLRGIPMAAVEVADALLKALESPPPSE